MSILVNPASVRALALDLDGTALAPGAVLSKRTIKAVQKCKERGISIIISTGRGLEAAEQFRAPLGAEGPMIYFNGAVIVEMPAGKILNSTLMDTKAAEFCIDLAIETGVYCQIYLPSEQDHKRTMLMSWRDGPEREMYYKHTGILSELGDLRKTIGEYSGCIKTMFLAEPEVLAVLRPRLEEGLGESVYIAQTLRTFLEVMDAKVSKGEGLKFILKNSSLKREEVLAFGDEESDLPLFDAAGYSLAPSNAKDTVKARANQIISSNAEDGVAAFLEDFFGF